MAKTVIGVLVMSIAIIRAGANPGILAGGRSVARTQGANTDAAHGRAPQASAGKVTLVAMGFTYSSRDAVEAWAEWYRTTIDPKTDVTFFEVPMIGGLATLGRWFIDRGMRNGTPAQLYDHVITVYQGTGDWKKWLGYSPGNEDDAYLIVLDRNGIVRWLHHGMFAESRSAELNGVLTSLDR